MTFTFLVAKEVQPALRRAIADHREPRTDYFELVDSLHGRLVSFADLADRTSRVDRLLARSNPYVALSWAAVRDAKSLGTVLASGEELGIVLAGLSELARRPRFGMVIHNPDTPKRRRVLRAIGRRRCDVGFCLSSSLERLLVDEIGFRPGQIRRIDDSCDHRFFTPAAAGGEYVLSVGIEQRDYPTLMAAARTTKLPLKVVASGWSPAAGFSAAGGVEELRNVEVLRGVPATELRDLYAGARLVVVPLHPCNYAAGVNAVLEAMATAKPVVVTSTEGLRDYVRPGTTGLVVPPHDPDSLRAAVEELWADDTAVAEFGRAGRAWVESAFTIEHYVASIAAGLGLPAPGSTS